MFVLVKRRMASASAVAGLGKVVQSGRLSRRIGSRTCRIGRRSISTSVLDRVQQSRVALQNAISMLEAGADPDTGEPFSSDQYGEFSRTISELQPLVDAYEFYVDCESASAHTCMFFSSYE